MALKEYHTDMYRKRYIGLGAPNEPAQQDGSTYYDADTKALYVFYGGTWFVHTPPSGAGEEFMRKLELTRVEDYFYTVKFTDEFDYDAGNGYLRNEEYDLGGCSTIQVGDLRGRCYDWLYNERVSFMVRTTTIEGKRYASIALGQGPRGLTRAVVESGEYDYMYRMIPFYTVDGVNEMGVCVSVNVVPHEDTSPTKGTHPGKKDMCQLALVRYILDHAMSVPHAVALVQNLNVFAMEGIELHIMVSDGEKTAVLEFFNNQMYVNYDTILTNFYTVKETLHAQGLERFDLLNAGAESATTVDAMRSLLDKVRYTRLYELDTDPTWYSDFNGIYKKYGDLNINSKPEDYAPLLEAARDAYRNRERNGVTWQTVHSAIYEQSDGIMHVRVQEGDAEYTYSIFSESEPKLTIKLEDAVEDEWVTIANLTEGKESTLKTAQGILVVRAKAGCDYLVTAKGYASARFTMPNTQMTLTLVRGVHMAVVLHPRAAGLTVEAVSKTTGRIYRGITSVDGIASLAVPSPATYDVTCDGYLTLTDVKVDKEDIVVSMHKGVELTVYLDPHAADVLVKAESTDYRAEARTLELGPVRLTVAADLQYTVTADGYESQTLVVGTDPVTVTLAKWIDVTIQLHAEDRMDHTVTLGNADPAKPQVIGKFDWFGVAHVNLPMHNTCVAHYYHDVGWGRYHSPLFVVEEGLTVDVYAAANVYVTLESPYHLEAGQTAVAQCDELGTSIRFKREGSEVTGELPVGGMEGTAFKPYLWRYRFDPPMAGIEEFAEELRFNSPQVVTVRGVKKLTISASHIPDEARPVTFTVVSSTDARTRGRSVLSAGMDSTEQYIPMNTSYYILNDCDRIWRQTYFDMADADVTVTPKWRNSIIVSSDTTTIPEGTRGKLQVLDTGYIAQAFASSAGVLRFDDIDITTETLHCRIEVEGYKTVDFTTVAGYDPQRVLVNMGKTFRIQLDTILEHWPIDVTVAGETTTYYTDRDGEAVVSVDDPYASLTEIASPTFKPLMSVTRTSVTMESKSDQYRYVAVEVDERIEDPAARCSYPEFIEIKGENGRTYRRANSCHGFAHAIGSREGSFDMKDWADHKITNGIAPYILTGHHEQATMIEASRDTAAWSDDNEYYTKFDFNWLSVIRVGGDTPSSSPILRIVFSDLEYRSDDTFNSYAFVLGDVTNREVQLEDILSAQNESSADFSDRHVAIDNRFYIGCFFMGRHEAMTLTRWGSFNGAYPINGRTTALEYSAQEMYQVMRDGDEIIGPWTLNFITIHQYEYLCALYVLMYKTTDPFYHSTGVTRDGVMDDNGSRSRNVKRELLPVTTVGGMGGNSLGDYARGSRNCFFWIYDLWGNYEQWMSGLYAHAEYPDVSQLWLAFGARGSAYVTSGRLSMPLTEGSRPYAPWLNRAPISKMTGRSDIGLGMFPREVDVYGSESLGYYRCPANVSYTSEYGANMAAFGGHGQGSGSRSGLFNISMNYDPTQVVGTYRSCRPSLTRLHVDSDQEPIEEERGKAEQPAPEGIPEI